MRLLSFSVSNFRSIRATQTLTLYHDWQHSTGPEEGWAQVSDPISVLIGPTASGKSISTPSPSPARHRVLRHRLLPTPHPTNSHAPYRLNPARNACPAPLSWSSNSMACATSTASVELYRRARRVAQPRALDPLEPLLRADSRGGRAVD
ncbi:hypothetical protein [Corynebacterium sp. Marseille-Q2823]|uniref:hypothetical protein n=1 Tax=Corynebacterium sp. Marseille-Q2823 TaxID=2736606 RepID=UPI0020CA87DA|nr:hypothetical protein [Corynebacterium sp. Marseille-Q2823]